MLDGSEWQLSFVADTQQFGCNIHARERGRPWKGADTGKIARKCQPIPESRRATPAQRSF
jgi:hypothetical protein